MATAAKAPQIGSLTALQQVAKGNGERTPAIADRVVWLCLAVSGFVGLRWLGPGEWAPVIGVWGRGRG